MSATCSKCAKAIAGNTYTVGSFVYHRECFLCSSCNAKLGGLNGTFQQIADHTYQCQSCFKCKKCNAIIKFGDQYLSVGSNNFHNKCLACDKCGRALTSKKFWKTADGLPACETHHGQ